MHTLSEVDAEAAGLIFTTDADPGIGRRRAGRGFTYRHPNGDPVRAPATLARIRALAVPPAWTDVWICPIAEGHLQATGRDARGRKQSRYHADFRRIRDEGKFDATVAFGGSLGGLREVEEEALATAGVGRDKVLAVVVLLLDNTLIRIGNPRYAKENRSFGLTTLRDRHVDVNGATMRFEFRTKHGRTHEVTLRDRRLATAVRRCQDLPGQVLFQYVDEDGARHPIGSSEVNTHIADVMGKPFTAKDFRTWGATVTAATALREAGPSDTRRERDAAVKSAICEAAARLGNTPTICKTAYVHPQVIEAYDDGSLLDARLPAVPRSGLDQEESLVLKLLEDRQAA